ncbi:MAG: hypothetical protein ACXW2E_01035 [Nitrososphaeraceae archaeon]
MTSYVYENVEVKKTNRTATKPLRSGKIDNLVEITPVQSIVGAWKKWVRESDLYIIDPEDKEDK